MNKRVTTKLGYAIDNDESDATSFFVDLNKVIPSIINIDGPFLYNQYIELVKTMFPNEHIIDWAYLDADAQQVLMRVRFKNGFILLKNGRTHTSDGVYDFKKKQVKYADDEFGYLVCGYINVLYNIYDGAPEDLIKNIKKLKLVESDNYSKIHLLCQNSDGMYTKEIPMAGSNLSFDLDLHYGAGFENYHDLNIKRITEQNKGIILLHGPPGCGKTFYVRRLIRDLSKREKNIMYMPNNMTDMLGTPVFNDFLIEWAEDYMFDNDSRKKPGILLVIEDAERVLIKREINQYGADGVSNILNSSDGILNDFLNIQVLATFNSDIENIDPAILRKKRALSIREFDKLTKEQAQKLIDHYGILYTAVNDMSLADIFSLKDDEDDDILLGKKKNDDEGIGFKFGK